ncbi:hypothetical protein F8S13_14090 [Chloroflexia bacterium SDU3-3]|nr:hypothetical protein F8S13_14090 [Chloroflexia bacterium SDU3-3]
MSYRRRYLALAMAGVSALALGAGARTFAAPVADDAAPASTVYLPMVRTAAVPTMAFITMSDNQFGDQARNPIHIPTYYDVSVLSGPDHTVQKVLTQQADLTDSWWGTWSSDRSYLFNNANAPSSVNIASTTVYTLPSGIYNWQPRGSRLLYTADNGAFISNADGSGVVQLLPEMTSQTRAWWSPDGTKILASVKANDSAKTDCYLLDANGTMIKKITTVSNLYYPQWTPDGRKISYLSPDENAQYRLWVQAVDGGEAKPLSPLDAELGLAVTYTWSPDSRYIAYNSYPTGLWISNADGAALYHMSTADSIYLQWSPNGSKLAYTVTVYNSGKFVSSALWSVNADGTSPQQLATHLEDITNYLWADDSSTLVYRGDFSHTLFTIPSAGGAAPTTIGQSVMLLMGRDSDGSLLFSRQVGEQYTITRSFADGSKAEDLALLDRPIQRASVAP